MISQKMFLNKEMFLKLDHPCYSQVQLQMYVRDVTDGDFVVWTPQIHIVVETERDMRDMIKLCRFYDKCFAPEILTRRLENDSQRLLPGSDVVQVQTGVGWQKTHITCHEPLCSIKWFHMSCLNLKRRRSGECASCRKCIKQL